MRFAIHTLGCKVNQYETAALEGALRDRGHVQTDFDGLADAYIINTCTVTAISDQKSRRAIRWAKKNRPTALVAVCGCYAQTATDDVRELGVDLIAGTADRMKFLADLEGLVAQRQAPMVTVDDIMTHRQFEPLTAHGMEGRTRAYLKVEDGCANFCTYCVIPYARGPVRSMSIGEAAAQATRLAAEGYRELVLTGIEISSWGRDFQDGADLADLIEAVCAAVPDLLVRMGSLEPRTVTDGFCRRLSALANLCPHFHLSLQSGCDTVLKRMNRKYDTAQYEQSVALLRRYWTDPGITTDLIVGFPGETEAEFAETMAFIQGCAFTAMHIFRYSCRTGTPAAEYPDQIPLPMKEDRAKWATALAAQMQADFLAQQVGKTLPVLFENKKNGLWRGHTPNYLEVRARGEDLHNQVKVVTITAAAADHLTA